VTVTPESPAPGNGADAAKDVDTTDAPSDTAPDTATAAPSDAPSDNVPETASDAPTETAPAAPSDVAAVATSTGSSAGPGEFTSESSPPVPPKEISDAPGAATGRRKEAIARVRLTPGTGQWTVNGKQLADFFPNKVHQQVVNDPFRVLQVDGRYDVIARVHGGGVSGQAGAIRLGIARALSAIDTEGNRPTLKKSGFLTRDPRAKERRKAGLKKARKAPQYSKR
jgi:small subunit ribosomal protein S9